MTKRQNDIFVVTLTAIADITLLILTILAIEQILSMSEAELFEVLTSTFRIFENFHPSVAVFFAIFSLTVSWTFVAVYSIACLIMVVRLLKERHNDS